MKSKSVRKEISQILEVYLSYWKWILLSIIIAIAIGYTYLRYATYEYKATATIKLREEDQSTKLPSLEDVKNSGFFSQGSDKIKDEVKILQSRTLAENIIKNLNLNISYFSIGKIKQNEIYKNPPVKINFFESDSLIYTIKKGILIRIKSKTNFILFEDDGKSLADKKDSDGKLHTFGDKINSKYGGFVIVPNLESEYMVNDLNLRISIRPVNKLANAYRKSLTISVEKGSSVINLALNQTVPQKAIDYLNELIKVYNNDVLKDKEEVVKITSDFINNRLQQVSQELGEVESNAELVQQQNNLTAIGSQTDLNLKARTQLEQQISTTSNSIQMISYLEEELNDDNKISDLLPANIGIGDTNTAQIIKSHNELVAQRDRLLRNSTEKNPVVIELNNQISTLKTSLQNSLESMKETSKLTLENLNNESRRISGQLYSAPTKERKFRSIQRQKDIKESLFLYLLEKREESAIRLGMYSPNAKIVDKAYSSFNPVAPNTVIIYLVSLIFGMLIPIGIIYIIDLLDNKVYTKDDVTNHLDIPYIGDIPKSSKKERLIKKVDYTPKAEAFRIVRSNIDFMLKDVKNRGRKLFITSTKAQEGKSHTSTNLASSISFSNKKVLLIEMDIRVPKIINYLGITDGPEIGLTDYIVDSSLKPSEVICNHPENEYLDILPSGTIPPNPSELLMSERVEEIIKYAEKQYDYVIVDTSAVGLVSDTLLISEFADLFVYVVSADNVDKRQLVHVAQPLYEDNRLPNFTLLLNGVKKGKKGYGYGYGYGSSPTKKKKWYRFFKKK
ncbi:GumC family protein [Winogradskyella vincentii]|uniref:non-specific protein-tyrosine kinase n=1 Tax=Winogradskyella vincentii TaxID=2877122 RepID=A0ABS7Y167_9FLAO|nr:polysaccharide biosynthesis tyrosine autokinase [Winogradskyella vincentii]MCA0152985.1 polysaccharide biosynthesis tyrosine autokinase [Winogradskyella vincentii]